ncbi:hypothetical protein [Streptomyces thioluteus]
MQRTAALRAASYYTDQPNVIAGGDPMHSEEEATSSSRSLSALATPYSGE